MPTTYPRLNIGAGRTPKQEGVINCDLYPGPNIQAVFDACKPWPFDDNSIGEVVSNHSLEHLPDPRAFFREAYRVLVPSTMCNLQLRLPYGANDESMSDLTHVRPYFAGSFCCVQPGYNDSIVNPQYDQWDTPFAVQYCYLRVHPRLRLLLKPIIRRWGMKILPFLWNACNELIVGLCALKTNELRARWMAMERKANVVPVAYCMYRAEYKGRDKIPVGDPLLFFEGR